MTLLVFTSIKRVSTVGISYSSFNKKVQQLLSRSYANWVKKTILYRFDLPNLPRQKTNCEKNVTFDLCHFSVFAVRYPAESTPDLLSKGDSYGPKSLPLLSLYRLHRHVDLRNGRVS